MPDLVEYLDWSDNSIEKHEVGESPVKFAEISFWVEDGDLVINLRRNTKSKKDFTLFLSHHTKDLYEKLKEHFED